jgi:DNA replication and repair protein RecF
MFLQQLVLSGFKNFSELEVGFSSRINCITGNNGVGKTNILDAIYYLSFCKSFFTSIDSLNIKHGGQFFIIEGIYQASIQTEHIYCGFELGKRKRFKRNKKEYEKLADHIGMIPLVMISPYDINLVTGGSDERRKFMDGIISQFDHAYLLELQKYHRVLTQRNSLLKDAPSIHYVDKEVLDIYDEQLVVSGKIIYEKRKQFIGGIEPVFQRYYSHIAQGKEIVTLNYQSEQDKKSLSELMLLNRNVDLNSRYTNSGIHKDDLELMLGEFQIKKLGSQGQQKTYLVALKLAQFEYINQLCGYKPLLLLDDVFDKLDEIRVEQIVKLVGEESFGQIFITDTSRERINNILNRVGGEYCHYHLEDNRLTKAI